MWEDQGFMPNQMGPKMSVLTTVLHLSYLKIVKSFEPLPMTEEGIRHDVLKLRVYRGSFLIEQDAGSRIVKSKSLRVSRGERGRGWRREGLLEAPRCGP